MAQEDPIIPLLENDGDVVVLEDRTAPGHSLIPQLQ